MAIKDLFKSTEEREREIRTKQLKLEREARRGIDKLDESAADLEQQRTDLWHKAGQYLKTGQKSEAENLVRQHKSRGILLNKLQQQKFVIESRLTQFSIASTMNGIVQSVSDFAKSLNLDPGIMDANMGKIDSLLDDTEVTWDILGRAYNRDVRKMKSQGETYGESDIASEMEALERETAASVGGAVKMPQPTDAVKTASSQEDIDAGLKDLKERLSKV